MDFKPKTEEEVKMAQLAPEGEYDFDVLGAEDAVSKKSGASMIKVKIGLYRDDGTIRNHVFDYLLPTLEAKLRHFCDTVGLLSDYESGTLTAAACKGRSGRARIGVDNKDANFPPKNVVKDYVLRKAKPLNNDPAVNDAEAEAAAATPPDGLPF